MPFLKQMAKLFIKLMLLVNTLPVKQVNYV